MFPLGQSFDLFASRARLDDRCTLFGREFGTTYLHMIALLLSLRYSNHQNIQS
jgi:hypothetical protein